MNDKIKELEQRVEELEKALRVVAYCLECEVEDITRKYALAHLNIRSKKDKKWFYLTT